MPIQPYLFFDGRCEEALNFYGKVLGARIEMLMRFKESPEPPNKEMGGPEIGEKVMHASFRVGDAVLMASDGQCLGKPSFSGFALSYPAATEADAERVFKALADGGEVRMPLTKTFFSPKFGMLADRFGVSWMVMVS